MVLNFDTEIEILLHDQNKIVTYKELSNKFDITPFDARKKLDKYILNKREKENEKSNFIITFIINAEEKTSKVKRIMLVNENELDKTSKEYKILSKQVYSIENNVIEDFNLIYTSDIDASNNIQRKSNINLIVNEADRRKSTAQLLEQPDFKPKLEELKPAAKALPKSTSTNTISNVTSNTVAKSNILVDSVKTNIKKEDQSTAATKHDASKKEDTTQISETVSKKLKINDEQKTNEASAVEKEAKPLIKTASKKAEPVKKANNQSITSFFKKA